MEKRNYYTKYDAGKAFCFSLFAPYILAFFVILITSIIGAIANMKYSDIMKSNAVMAVSAVLSPLAFLSVYFLFHKKYKIEYKVASKINFKLDIINVILCIVIAFCCVFGFSNFVSLFDAIFNLFGIKPNTSWPVPIDTWYWLLFNIFAVAVLPAIAEELVFRGIIFNGLSSYGKKKAIIFSALLFSLMHTSISQTIYPILAGCVFAFVVSKTGNILYSMLIHFCNNCIVIVNRYIMVKSGASTDFCYDLTFLNIFLSVIFAIVAGAVIFAIVKFLMKKDKNMGETELEKVEFEPKPNSYLFVGVFAGVLFWVINLFM